MAIIKIGKNKENNMSVWSTCPYSVNNKCVACKVLKVTCDGKRYINCEQYLITTKKKSAGSSLYEGYTDQSGLMPAT